jgi:hypothetical protein
MNYMKLVANIVKVNSCRGIPHPVMCGRFVSIFANESDVLVLLKLVGHFLQFQGKFTIIYKYSFLFIIIKVSRVLFIKFVRT